MSDWNGRPCRPVVVYLLEIEDTSSHKTFFPCHCATKSLSSSSLLAGKCRIIACVSSSIPGRSVDPSSLSMATGIFNLSKITSNICRPALSLAGGAIYTAEKGYSNCSTTYRALTYSVKAAGNILPLYLILVVYSLIP